MPQTIIIILAIVIILLLLRRTREGIVGICAKALDTTVHKNENKNKILTLLASLHEASNSDIRQVLGVSERSVVRYMDELEREGRVIQVGKTGRGTIYRLK